MPRKSSFSRSSSRPTPNRNTTQAAPRPNATPSRTTNSQPGFFSNMMGSIATGIGFGAGSEVGHQAVRSLFGGSNTHTQQTADHNTNNNQPNANPCQLENNQFVECLKFNSNNINLCQDLLDNLKSCETRFN